MAHAPLTLLLARHCRAWTPVEAQWITEAEINDVEGVVAIPGAVGFLNSVPGDQWALVTSAPKALALRRLAAAGITPPAVLVTAEDVASGKPDPACYVLGAQRLGVPVQDCLVFEDASVGIRAGRRLARMCWL